MTLLRNAVSVLSAAVLLAGCSPGVGASSSAPTSVPDGPLLAMASSGSADICTDAGWYELELSTDERTEVPFLQSLTACTDPAATKTWIRNDSDAVWTLRAGYAAVVDQQTTNERLVSFREIAGRTYRSALLLPKTSVLVHDAPRGVTWSLHPGLSTAWLTHDKAIDLVEDRMREEAAKLFAPGSPRRQALITCTLEAATVADDAMTDAEPMEELIKGLASSARDCARDWRAADDAAREAAGLTPKRRWVFPLRSWQAQTTFMEQSDSWLARLARIGTGVVRAAR